MCSLSDELVEIDKRTRRTSGWSPLSFHSWLGRVQSPLRYGSWLWAEHVLPYFPKEINRRNVLCVGNILVLFYSTKQPQNWLILKHFDWLGQYFVYTDVVEMLYRMHQHSLCFMCVQSAKNVSQDFCHSFVFVFNYGLIVLCVYGSRSCILCCMRMNWKTNMFQV